MISSFEYGKIFFNRLANQHFSKIAEPDVASVLHKNSSGKSVSFKDTKVLGQTSEDFL